MSNLRRALAGYLELRRSLGFKLQRADKRLGDFLDFLEAAHSPVITTALAVAWAMQPEQGKPSWWATRLGLVRGFARFVHTLDPNTEVPALDLLPRGVKRQPPYLYSEEEVQALMEAAGALKPRFRALTCSTLIGLLAATGMRVGEAIALDRENVDWRDAVLTIRYTKFGKSREIPLHPSTVEALARYDRERNLSFPACAISAFFVSLRKRRLSYQAVHTTFLRLVDEAGLADRKPRRPRIHDLRHSFACWTLREWYDAGLDVEQQLPLLSTYLGHVSPSTTYWYLSATPELLGRAAKRLQNHFGDLP